MSDKKPHRKRKRGRPRVNEEQIKVSFRLRRGRNSAEDALMDRLSLLTESRQRSRYLRRVLTTGEIDAVLDRELAQETQRVANALDAMAGLWDDDEDDTL